MEDAVNLSWKLAATLQGWEDEGAADQRFHDEGRNHS
nr:hypothetical protein [Bradyrhizobium elkanii]